jgi:uncharacterized membrane protein
MVLGLFLSLMLFTIKDLFSGMLYMDMVGTVFCALLLGPWRGAIVGCLTNVSIALIEADPAYMNYTVINVLIALLIGFFARSNHQIFNPNDSQGRLLVKILTWGFVLSLVSSTLAVFIKNKYATSIVFDSDNLSAFSLFVFIKNGEIVSIFSAIPYDLLSSFPDKLFTVVLALYLIHFFVNPKHYENIKEKKSISSGTRNSIMAFLAVYSFPFYDIAVNGMVNPAEINIRDFSWINSIIWSLPIFLAFVAWIKSGSSLNYYFNGVTNAKVNFGEVYEDVIQIIIVIWSLLLSSQAAFTDVELESLVKDGMGMIAFIGAIGFLPPFVSRYFGRGTRIENKENASS